MILCLSVDIYVISLIKADCFKSQSALRLYLGEPVDRVDHASASLFSVLVFY